MSLNVLIAAESFPIVSGLEAIAQLVLAQITSIVVITNFNDLILKLGSQIDYHILLSDTNINNIDGFTILERAKYHNPNIKTLFVSLNSNPILIKRYIEAGANGYICTNAPEDEFKKAIQMVYSGDQYLPEELTSLDSQPLLSISATENPFDQLSKKEFVVLMLLLKGKGTKEISTILNLKLSTTSTFRNRILKKLEINNLIELVSLAREHQLIQDALE